VTLRVGWYVVVSPVLSGRGGRFLASVSAYEEKNSAHAKGRRKMCAIGDPNRGTGGPVDDAIGGRWMKVGDG